MTSLSQSTVTLISTFIGILTAASPFLITTIYNEIFENPNLVVHFSTY
jgi:hemoglobin-like flavoprotein